MLPYGYTRSWIDSCFSVLISYPYPGHEYMKPFDSCCCYANKLHWQFLYHWCSLSKKVHLFSLYIRNHYNFRCSLKYIRTTEFLYFIFWDNFKNFRVDKIDIYSNKMRFFCGRVRNERYWLFCVLRILRQLTIKIILSRIWKKKVVIAPDFGFRQGCQ